MPLTDSLVDPRAVLTALDRHDYLADIGLATSVHLALALEMPLFLEGPPGVGKTEVAKVLARVTGGRLIRLQCYEGLDLSQSLYEWDHARQLLHLRVAEATDRNGRAASPGLEHELYDERFLLRRPLLDAISSTDDAPPVLLIDEVDRADDEFEALLLEILADWSVTVPELGTIRATRRPVTILTSNRTRDVHDALKRRCLYHWLDHPDAEREVAIVRRQVPDLDDTVAAQVAAMVARFRSEHLVKAPGVAEAVDWARALAILGVGELDAATAEATLGAVLKYREDQIRMTGMLPEVVAQALAAAG